MSRASLRSRWITAVVRAEIGNACKALLLYLAATCMTAGGYIDPPRGGRDQLAAIFGVHPQRIAERVQEAKRAGLLVQVDGSGVRGREARYIATLPPANVPVSGTDKPGLVTGERYPQIGTHENALRTDERYTQHARALRDRTRVRHDVVRNVGVERDDVLTERRQRREADPDSPLAAILRKLDGRRPSCAGLRPRTAVAA